VRIAMTAPAWRFSNVTKLSGQLRTRLGWRTIHTFTAEDAIDAFSVESPSTTEVWHYIALNGASTATLRVLDEQCDQLFTYPLGSSIAPDAVVGYSVQFNQMMIGSSAFSSPIYGLPGGGLTQAVKTTSENPDTTSLDLLPGRIFSFGDRVGVAFTSSLYFCDPGVNGLRAFVAENNVALNGTIYDVVQASEGALYVATSDEVVRMASDALGKGQLVAGFIETIPGLWATRPRNMVAVRGGVVLLAKDHLILVRGTQQTVIEIGMRDVRQTFTQLPRPTDLRSSAELYAADDRVFVSFRADRVCMSVDLSTGHQSWITSEAFDCSLRGVLWSREGEPLFVLSDRIVAEVGNVDDDNDVITGVAATRIEVPEDESPVVRFVTAGSGNIGQDQGISVNGTTSTKVVPTKQTDVVIETSEWAETGTLSGRSTRTVRHGFHVRSTEPALEVSIEGGDRRFDENVVVDVIGQGRNRRDRE
jgi:hypothetical protein